MLPIKSCVMRIDRVFDVLPCMQTLLIEGLSGGGGDKCYKEQYEKFPVPVETFACGLNGTSPWDDERAALCWCLLR